MIRLTLAILLVFFLPGFSLTLIFLKKTNMIQRFLQSIFFSIIINVAVAFFLGGSQFLKNFTGGYTLKNITGAILIISIIFLIIYFVKQIKNEKRK